MGEIWKDIEGYEGYYQISNLGRVKSCGRVLKWKNGGIRVIKEKLLFVNIRPNKYPLVTLCKNCIEVSYNIHRLIGEHFIPNPNTHVTFSHGWNSINQSTTVMFFSTNMIISFIVFCVFRSSPWK